MANEQLTINIRPPVSVYATYRRLSYQPWYAIAEFVDNSTQNYYDHKHELKEIFKKEKDKCLKIIIDYDSNENTLIIKDNANGMDFNELNRAVILNRPPADPSGRCEFGMGLKTAACWFGRKWTIETTRLGSHEKFCVTIDVDDIAQQSNEQLIVDVQKLNPTEHYTIIKIFDLYKPIKGKTTQRIKDQLSSMYREDLRSGEIEIYWNGAKLAFGDPPILEEKHKDGTKTEWKQNIEFNVPWESQHQALPVKGWIGIRIPASQRDAGFVLLRRGRVIIGGPEKGYKPEEIFGQGNTYRSQRLIGELRLDDWPVSQAKDTFDWSGGLEDKFIEILKEKVKDYSQKAEGYRAKEKKATNEDMQEAAKKTRQVFESKEFTKSIGAELSMPTAVAVESKKTEDVAKVEKISEGPIVFSLPLPREKWIFKLFWQDQLSDAHWMSVDYPQENEIHIYLNSSHPFFDPYIKDISMLELIQKFVMALALAEKMARSVSTTNQIESSDFRNYMNLVLRYAGKINGELV